MPYRLTVSSFAFFVPCVSSTAPLTVGKVVMTSSPVVASVVTRPTSVSKPVLPILPTISKSAAAVTDGVPTIDRLALAVVPEVTGLAPLTLSTIAPVSKITVPTARASSAPSTTPASSWWPSLCTSTVSVLTSTLAVDAAVHTVSYWRSCFSLMPSPGNQLMPTPDRLSLKVKRATKRRSSLRLKFSAKFPVAPVAATFIAAAAAEADIIASRPL